jgi:hypothetical protein
VADRRTPVEELLRSKSDQDLPGGPELSRREMQRPRTIEGYLTASDPPRWMTRLVQIDAGIARERERLAEAHREAEDWQATVAAWRFDPELNELIREHNEWYPVERRLPFDLRTRDYVRVNGRSYRRPVLDAAWALAEFPPR